MQPQQVDPPGMQCLVRALQGTVIRLVEPGDDGSATSIAETIDTHLPLNRSVQDPLGLNQGGPELEEGEWRPSLHEAMDQDDVLEHNASLDEDSAYEAGMAYGQTTDSQSEAMDVVGAGSELEGFSDRPMDAQDARHDRDRHEPTWDEGESETAKRRRKYPKVRPYTVPVRQEINNGWYQWEDLLDPSEVAPPARRVGLPNVDGSIGGDTRYALPPPRESRSNFYYNRELHRQVTYDRGTKSDKGHYPHITEEERVARAQRQNTALQRDAFWENELRASHYLPTIGDSPVNYRYRVKSTTYAVPYHVVGPMTWEYPYHNGQAQEDLADRLIPASLYGMNVVRPGYRSANAKPATATEAQAACDGGTGFMTYVSDTDVNAHAMPVGEVGQGHQGAALLICTQPECAVAGGREPLFANLEQWAAHWNSFHVAVAPAFNCMVRGCTFGTTPAPDALDSLFRHFQDAHPDVYDHGRWPNLTDLVTRGLKVRANTHYWPPTNVVGELQRPVTAARPSPLQLESPIVAARWAAREAFHKAVVTRRRSFKKAKRRESKSGERSSSASKVGARAPSESDARTLSESADEWSRFRRDAEKAAVATSSQAKTPGVKKSKSSKGSGGLKDSKSSASAVAKTGLVKGSKRKGKEAGLAEKPRWDTSYKIPKRSQVDTSISSGAPTPRKADKAKRPNKKSSKPKSGKGAQTQSGKGSATALPSTSTTLAIDHWTNYRSTSNRSPVKVVVRRTYTARARQLRLGERGSRAGDT